jgi:UDP-glucose 4-epimerase
MGKTIFITGMSGYLGTALCRELDRSDWCDRVVGVDLRPPLYKYDRIEYRRLDINDPALAALVGESKPDIFIHLAFIVDPIPDEAKMQRVNVDGTRNALAAAAGVEQVLVASSGTAYGAWPDNPVPLKETDPIRPHPGFAYARQKAELEALCRDFMAKYPDKIVAIIRPAVVYGPGVNNYLSNLFGMPVISYPSGSDTPIQFIHEDDVIGAIVAILRRRGRGAFNLAPPDTLTLREAVALTNKPALPLPFSVLAPIAALTWKLGISPYKVPASFLDFMRYPWVLDSSRLRAEIGYSFRYSSRETLEIMLRAKGFIA